MLHQRLEHPWETVVKAACRKYPNPLNPSVLGTDVIDRKVKDGVLYSHRLVTTQWRFPRWISPLFGHQGPYYASEWSEVNPESKEMVVRTINISLGTHVSVNEVVTYEPHPDNPKSTLLTQQTFISIQGVPLIDHLERLLTLTMEQNANKGRQAVEWVIDKLDSKSTDDLLLHACRQLDDITNITKQGMEDIQNAAKKSFDEFQNLTVPPPTQSIPKL
ncbi:PREDICTED: protein slowmo isoform X2 [Eufriesea mexicana]|uniref:protein slowmo isoform X2 n=1 Tax=Eufriesea mexicana TaxID=516756 RepID=UPI00083C1A69|nr:PREDICTED: protein slowmo isoform X2 [Eufriesea mexicana]